MSIAPRTWGVWEPIAEDTSPRDSIYARPLEWWPSGRAAEASLRARSPRKPGTTNIDPERRADGLTKTDAQFYGNEQSAIFLYEVEGEPGANPRPAGTPYAVLEFGPRGGIRRRDLTPPDNAEPRA
ncbi:hypothetical protein [Streptomyces lateritius]|uniref:hypothetical protein n=1 Tax=Streptomyces lateritius TaxID=67313 RepID=UPI00167BF035|nr:hypothetical protein [Streptomyces lateritius]GGU11342.1 hypothetical protein GCM10010272_65660 [Streptomyces lateritius]